MHRSATILASSFLALWMMLNPVYGFAQDNALPGKHHREMTALERDDAARRFSINNDGVGVFVNFAAVPELVPERLIKAIEANFANKGIPVDIYTNVSRGNLTTVTFFLGGIPFVGSGKIGYLLGEIPDGFNTVVKAFHQEQAKKAALGESSSTRR